MTATTDLAVSSPLHHRFQAMATRVSMQVVSPGPAAAAALERAEDVFHRVERACTRFDPDSPLMRANAAGTSWTTVPRECFDALTEAEAAHRRTGGVFDPRVLRALTAQGYDRSLPFRDGAVRVAGSAAGGRTRPRGPWRPRFDAARSAVKIGRDPVDLGGIGKGLAVRWAMAELRDAGTAALVEAGGDVATTGDGPDGEGWRIAVEDPTGGSEPLAVLAVRDAAAATSSVRIRRWEVDGRTVHHLIDPRTGEPGGAGLVAVSVVDADPAAAEITSKALFLAGATGIRAAAEERGAAALWVDAGGRVSVSRGMRPHLLWRR